MENTIKEENKVLAWIKKHRIDLTLYFGFLAIIIVLITIAVAPQYSAAVKNNHAYNPIFIEIGSFSIAWYAIFILSGLLMAAYMARTEFKRLGWDTEMLLDGIIIIAPLSIVGARLYYILFTPGMSITEFFRFQDGGLAISGAIIVASVLVYFFARWKKINVFVLADILAVGFLMGQISGRWGNFMNAEAHGPIVNNNFIYNILPNFIKHQMSFSSDGNLQGAIYHPMFLYESLWNLIGLTILFVLRRKKMFKVGDIFGFYIIWYGFGRGLLIEPFRTDPLEIVFGSLTLRINVALSLILFVGGGILYLILKRVFIQNEPYYFDLANNEITLLDRNQKSKKRNLGNN